MSLFDFRNVISHARAHLKLALTVFLFFFLLFRSINMTKICLRLIVQEALYTVPIVLHVFVCFFGFSLSFVLLFGFVCDVTLAWKSGSMSSLRPNGRHFSNLFYCFTVQEREIRFKGPTGVALAS